MTLQNEAVQILRRAQLQYTQRSEELWARSQGSPEDHAPQASPGTSKQQERRRRSREEAQAKVGSQSCVPFHWAPPTLHSHPHVSRFPQALEAEVFYQACVREANARQQDLENTKHRIVSHVRKLVLQGDEVLRRVRLFPLAALSLRHSRSSLCAPAEGPSTQPLSHSWDPRTPSPCQAVGPQTLKKPLLQPSPWPR